MEDAVFLVGALVFMCAVYIYYYKRKSYWSESETIFSEGVPVESVAYYTKIATTEDECDWIVTNLLRGLKSHRALGFDCEWRPQFERGRGKRNRVALLQLATDDGYCGLFRLCQMNGVPDSLKDLLEDPTIYKVGVAPDGDALYLYQDYGVELKSTLDVRHLAVLCGHQAWLGLAALSRDVLGIFLDKSKAITCSDWEADYLSRQQAKYAAMDAYVGIRIFVRLVTEYHRRKWETMTVGCSIITELNDIYDKFVDVNFRTKQRLRCDGFDYYRRAICHL